MVHPLKLEASVFHPRFLKFSRSYGEVGSVFIQPSFRPGIANLPAFSITGNSVKFSIKIGLLVIKHYKKNFSSILMGNIKKGM